MYRKLLFSCSLSPFSFPQSIISLLFPFPLASTSVTMQRALPWCWFPWQPPKHRPLGQVSAFTLKLLHWWLVPLYSSQHCLCSLHSGTDCYLCTSQIKASTTTPAPPLPSIPQAFDAFSCQGGRAFDHHSKGVGNLIANLNVMLGVVLIPRGLINHSGDGRDKL